MSTKSFPPLLSKKDIYEFTKETRAWFGITWYHAARIAHRCYLYGYPEVTILED